MRLLLPRCSLEGLSEAALRAALALELEASGLTLATPEAKPALNDVELEVQSDCAHNFELELHARRHGAHRARRLSLAGLPEKTRARLLALSLAELVEHLGSEPRPPSETQETRSEQQPAGAPEPPASTGAPSASAGAPSAETEERSTSTPKPSASPHSPAPAASIAPRDTKERSPEHDVSATSSLRRGALELGPKLRLFASGDALFGGHLELHAARWLAGATVLFGGSTSSLGELDVSLWHGFVGYHLVDHELSSRFSVSLGPRLGAGRIQVAGSTREPNVTASSAGALYLDGALFGKLRWRASRHLGAALKLEGGVSRGASALADGASLATYDGAFVGGAFGLLLSL